MEAVKENARRMWKSGRATHKSKASVAHARLRGRVSEMESTREGRMRLAGLGTAAMLAAMLAWMLLDMAVFA